MSSSNGFFGIYQGNTSSTASTAYGSKFNEKTAEERKRKETAELLGAGKRKEATVNPPGILTPSIHKSKNGPRLHVNNKPLNNPWKAFVSETKEDYDRRMKLIPLHGQT